jgi:hypothetical protein
MSNRTLRTFACLVALLSCWSSAALANSAGNAVVVQYSPAAGSASITGRLILLFSRDLSREPRQHVESAEPLDSPYQFGLNVQGWVQGKSVTLDDHAFGWPAASLSKLPPGDYLVQAVLNRYEQFQLADGRQLELPTFHGQKWPSKPGNLYSEPLRIHIDARHPTKLQILLDQTIPDPTPKSDTEFVRHVRIRSELLSRFWGRDVFLTAHVLLPYGFDSHPQSHFPLMVFHGHYTDDIRNFRTTPPDPNLPGEYSKRFHLADYNRIEQAEEFAFFKKWTSPDFPRFLVMEIDHGNPYFDDSYAVNSANLGPYGDAINKELIPEVERRFRGIGAGWARFTYGGSTGGWEALATQVFYPEMYNGAFAACPDPIDFRAYTLVNLYEDSNAYTLIGEAARIERPALRNYLGEVFATQRDQNYMELVAGDHGRSAGQYDAWQAVFGPVGSDGYPKPIFDKLTGSIDPSVAAYWREHFDLSYLIQRDWPVLAAKLTGKIHIYVGNGDNYYATDAVYFAQERLEALRPAYAGTVAYGDRAEHCWNGDPNLTNGYSRLHYHTQYLPIILQRIAATAPPGADLSSWRY